MREQITYPPPLDDIHISRHSLDSINVPLILTLPWLFGVNDILSVTFIFGISFEMPKQTLDRRPLLSPFLWGTFSQNSSMSAVGFDLFLRPVSSVSDSISTTCTSSCIPSLSTASSEESQLTGTSLNKKFTYFHLCEPFFSSSSSPSPSRALAQDLSQTID